MPLKLAIVGRPNVGKSTLFNRLAGKRIALVDDRPGVTRDRREAPGDLQGIELLLIDTAGFEDVSGERLEARMRAQTEAAIADADVVLFVMDARAGVTALDRTFADVLRRSAKPVIVAANKCEGMAADAGAMEAYSSASASRCKFPPSTRKGWAISPARCARRWPAYRRSRSC